MNRPDADKKLLRRWMSRWGEENLRNLLIFMQADTGSKGVNGDALPFPEIWEIMGALQQENGCLTLRDLAVDGHDLMALGITGRDIGVTLNRLLTQVLEEELPNEKEALLAEIRRNI